MYLIHMDGTLQVNHSGSSGQRKEAEGTPQKPITDADYADDIAILANTPNQAETQLHSLER